MTEENTNTPTTTLHSLLQGPGTSIMHENDYDILNQAAARAEYMGSVVDPHFARAEQQWQQRERQERADNALERLHEAGLGNPNWERKKDVSERIYQRTDPRPQREYTSQDIKVAPYPKMPQMSPTWTPTQQQAIQKLRNALLAQRDVQAGSFSILAALRDPEVQQAVKDSNLPLQVFTRIQSIIDKATSLGWTSDKIYTNLNNAFTSQSQPGFDPYQGFPIRHERLAGAAGASSRMDALYRQVATGLNVSESKLRQEMPALSDEQLSFVLSSDPQKFIHAGAGGGKSTTMIWATLLGMARGDFQFRDVQFEFPTRASTDVVRDRFDRLAREGLLPGVNWSDAREKQFHTLHSNRLSDLTRHPAKVDPFTGQIYYEPNAMQKMGLGDYQLVGAQRGTAQTFEQSQAQREMERRNRLQAMGHGLPQNYDWARMESEIGQARTARTLPETRYKERMKQGALDVSLGKFNTPDAYLYQYGGELHQNKQFDLDDVAALWVTAFSRGLLMPAARVGFMDELQNVPYDFARAASLQASQPGRITMMGGDMDQQITGTSNVSFRHMLPAIFPQASTYELHGNYRSTQSIVAHGQALKRQIATMGGEVGPYQVAMSPDPGEPVGQSLYPSFNQMFQGVGETYLERIGMTPEMIGYNVSKGRHPLMDAPRTPAQVGIIVQMRAEIGSIKEAIAKILAPSLPRGMNAMQVVDAMFYSSSGALNIHDPSTQHQGRIGTDQQFLGYTIEEALATVPHIGRWDQVGYLKNRYVSSSRPSQYLHEFSTWAVPDPSLSSSAYDNQPVQVGGELFDPVRAAGMSAEMESLVFGHGVSKSDLQPVHRFLLEKALETTGGNISLSDAQKRGIQSLLQLVAQLAPHETSGFTLEGSGLLAPGEGAGAERDIMEAAGGHMQKGALNAAVLSGQFRRGGSPMVDEYMKRLIEEIARSGKNLAGTASLPDLQTLQKIVQKMIGMPGSAIEKYAMKALETDYPADASLLGGEEEKVFGSREGTRGVSASSDPLVRAAMQQAFEKMGIDPGTTLGLRTAQGNLYFPSGMHPRGLRESKRRLGVGEVMPGQQLEEIMGGIQNLIDGLPVAGITQEQLDAIKNPRVRAILAAVYQSIRNGESILLPHDMVNRELNRYPFTVGAMVRNISNPQEGRTKGFDTIQSRLAPYQTLLSGFFATLEGQMQGNSGGVRHPDKMGGMIGLDALNRELTQRTGHFGFTQKHMTDAQRKETYQQIEQVRTLRRTLKDPSSRAQLAQGLANIFRVVTGDSPFKRGPQGDEANKMFDSFFSGLKDENMPRTLDQASGFVNALVAATTQMQQTGTLSRGMVNEVLRYLGQNPSNPAFLMNQNNALARGFGDPSKSLSLSTFARGTWFSDKDKKERMSILSEMTRIPINQGQLYHFMGGRPGFAGIAGGQRDRGGLSAGMAGTLHPLPGHNFRMVYDVQFWRDKKLFAPGESYDKLPGEMLYGPVVRFNPNGNSDEKDWHLVRADQLALPGGLGTGEGAAIAASSSGLSSQMPKGRVYGASDAIDPMEESPVIKDILDAFNAARQEKSIARTIEDLPPLQEGFARATHITNANLAEQIVATGLDYSKQGMLSSTARAYSKAEDVQYSMKGDPRFDFEGAKAVVMDIPGRELRLHESISNSPGRVPAHYIVGVVDAFNATRQEGQQIPLPPKRGFARLSPEERSEMGRRGAAALAAKKAALAAATMAGQQQQAFRPTLYDLHKDIRSTPLDGMPMPAYMVGTEDWLNAMLSGVPSTFSPSSSANSSAPPTPLSMGGGMLMLPGPGQTHRGRMRFTDYHGDYGRMGAGILQSVQQLRRAKRMGALGDGDQDMAGMIGKMQNFFPDLIAGFKANGGDPGDFLMGQYAAIQQQVNSLVRQQNSMEHFPGHLAQDLHVGRAKLQVLGAMMRSNPSSFLSPKSSPGPAPIDYTPPSAAAIAAMQEEGPVPPIPPSMPEGEMGGEPPIPGPGSQQQSIAEYIQATTDFSSLSKRSRHPAVATPQWRLLNEQLSTPSYARSRRASSSLSPEDALQRLHQEMGVTGPDDPRLRMTVSSSSPSIPSTYAAPYEMAMPPHMVEMRDRLEAAKRGGLTSMQKPGDIAKLEQSYQTLLKGYQDANTSFAPPPGAGTNFLALPPYTSPPSGSAAGAGGGGKTPVHITADTVSIASSSGAGGFAWVGRAAGALGGLLGAGGSSSSSGGGGGGGGAPLNGTAMPPGSYTSAQQQGQGAPPGSPGAAALFAALMGMGGPGGAPPSAPGGGRFPNVAQAFSYGNGDIMIGRFLSRMGGDFSMISQMAGKTASDAAMEGGNYRRYSMQVPYDASETYGRILPPQGSPGMRTHTVMTPSGKTITVTDVSGTPVHPISENTPGTSGFFDFTSQSPQGIQALQANMLPMYSDTQIAQGIHDYTSLNARTKLNGPTVRATTDIMAVAALSGIDPTQLTEMFAQTTGAQASGLYGSSILGTRNANYYAPQLAGMLHHTLGGNLSGPAVQNYMQAMSSLTPVLAGIGAPNAMNQAGTLMQLGMNAGLGAESLPGVAQVGASLAQMGSNPNLMQQFVLAQTYGEKALTAAPQYWQYKQGLQQQGMQLQGLQLQQRMNVPQISINADNAQIQMGRVSIQAQQFQLAQGQATFAEQQYQQTQQLGPIGETPQQTGRSAYFQYMARQTAAGYNPLSQDNASTFQFKGKPFGLQNLEFYTGIEHQRNMLTLGRSPLLADAAFQEQMKYLNKQETFYNQELALQNQQRQFTVTWTQKSLEMQAKQLAAASNVEKVQEQQLKVDIENQKIYAANLPQMVSNLQKIIINTQQQMQGQGPIRGHNMSDITQLVQDIAKSTPDNQLEARANQLFGNDPTSAGIFLSLVKQVKATPASQISATLNSTTDQGLISELMGQNQAGASLGQQVQAGQSNTALFQGGIDAWNNLNKTIGQSNKLNQQLASAMSGSTGLTYWVSQMTGKASALADSMGALSSIMGGIGGIFKIFAGGAGGAGTGGGAGAGEGMMMGVGGMVGPPPASQGEFSPGNASTLSDSALLNQMNQVKGPVSAMTHILENLQAFMQKKSGSTSFAHYGIGSPQVNADFHQKMWYGYHQGVDLAANQGSPLSEFIGGEVKATGFFPWGGEVDVEIPGGTTERYLHLSQIAVHPGQVVRRGDRIGLTGGGTPASGFGYWSRGSHLHTQYDYGNINQGIDPWVIWAMAGEKNLGEFIGSSSLGSFGNTSRADRLGAAIAAKNMGGGGLYHLYGGGIAMRPVTSRLADGGEPEAVIPLSKLKSVLSGNVGGSSSSTNTSSSGGIPLKQYIVDKLIGTLNLTQHLASSTMSDAEKDQLMADTLDALQTAAYAFMSHNG